MGCDIIKGPDGITTVMCSRGRKAAPTCFFCGFMSTKQCDFKAGGRRCDRHLCDEHAIAIAPGIDVCEDHPR